MRSGASWPASPIRGSGYVCGQLRLEGEGGENQEGLYWRYEMAARALESRLAGVTAGNGAINAVRREAYIALEPTRGQDISLPYELTKRGWRAVFEPAAVAREPMAATLGSEFRRKRRMLAGAWATMLRHGMLSPRGYGPAYAFQILSHRGLRYLSPILHLVALGTNLALLGQGCALRRHPRRPARAARRRGAGARRAACASSRSLATTSRSPRRAPPASGITCVAACRGPGRRPRERDPRPDDAPGP